MAKSNAARQREYRLRRARGEPLQRHKSPRDPETEAAILRRLSEGESLSSIGRDLDMPSATAVRHYIMADANFAARYRQARDLGLDTMAEQVIAIADGEDSSGDVQRDRLRFDARRWYLSKLAPRRYGDSMRVELGGQIDLRAALSAAQRRMNERARLGHGLTIDADDDDAVRTRNG